MNVLLALPVMVLQLLNLNVGRFSVDNSFDR